MQNYNKINNQLKLQLQCMPPEFLPEEFLSQQQDWLNENQNTKKEQQDKRSL